MNRMSDYHGPPEWDTELEEVIQAHMERSSRERHPSAHPSQLFSVDDADAAILDVESELVERLSKEQVFIKETRDDLKLEALKCFSRHNRPKAGCPDWKTEAKIVGRKTGVPPPWRKYLCEMCPVASYVEFKERQRANN